MASLEAIAIACDKSCKTIEQWLSDNGVDGVKIPRLHRDREILRKQQLEAIAENLPDVDSNRQLEHIQKLARNNATKAELLDAILGELS